MASARQSRLVRTLTGRGTRAGEVFRLAGRVPRSVGDRITNSGGSMRKCALLVGIIVALGLGGVPSAFAANPGANR